MTPQFSTLRGLTLPAAFARWVTDTPDRVALVDGDQRITFRELDRRSDRLAAHLVAEGIGGGDVIACQLPNIWEYACLLLAAAKIGTVISPQHIISRASEIEYCLGFGEAKAFFYVPSYADFDYRTMFGSVRDRLPSLRLVVTVRGAAAAGETEFAALLTGPAAIDLGKRRPKPEDLFVLSFTSGTSGKPKGVLHTHDGPVSNALATGELLGVGPDEVILCASSFSFAYGTFTVMVAFVRGATQVLLDSFAPGPFFDLVERERVSFVFGVPAIALALVNHPRAATTDFSALSKFMISGATHPPPLVYRMRDLFGCTPITLWGMTETYRGTVTRLDDPMETIATTVGGCRPGWEMVALDENGRILPPGEPGELAVRGPMLFKEYLKSPEVMTESFTDGWFKTGDLATVDERGYVRITGRIKDLIRRGGVSISPREIEDIFYAHPKIRDCALVAMPDDRLGERPCLFAVLQPGADLALDELRQFLDAKGIAKYKWPERLEFIDELPLNAARKVRKNLLRDRIAAKLAEESGAK